MADQTEARVEATRYGVNVVPERVYDHSVWQIEVEYRGEGRWAVMHRGFCLGVDGEWEYEPPPSSREDDWLDTHRFDLDTALALAVAEAPKVSIGYLTAAEVADRAAAGVGVRAADGPTPAEGPAAALDADGEVTTDDAT